MFYTTRADLDPANIEVINLKKIPLIDVVINDTKYSSPGYESVLVDFSVEVGPPELKISGRFKECLDGGPDGQWIVDLSAVGEYNPRRGAFAEFLNLCCDRVCPSTSEGLQTAIFKQLNRHLQQGTGNPQ